MSRAEPVSGRPSNLEKVLEATGLQNVVGKQIMFFRTALKPLLRDAFELGRRFGNSDSGKRGLSANDWLKLQSGDLANFMVVDTPNLSDLHDTSDDA